jgi:hypothetical protein
MSAHITLPKLPKGMKWHTEGGWAAHMLPEGYRPLLDGEMPEEGDQVYYPREAKWEDQQDIMLKKAADCTQFPQRTMRPLPGMTYEETSIIMRHGLAIAQTCKPPCEPGRKPFFRPKTLPRVIGKTEREQLEMQERERQRLLAEVMRAKEAAKKEQALLGKISDRMLRAEPVCMPIRKPEKFDTKMKKFDHLTMKRKK